MSDWFEIIRPYKVFDINNVISGDVPFYDTGNKLNVVNYINDCSYENKNNDLLILITFDGNCYQPQHKKFAVRGHGSMFILKLLNKNIDLNLNSKLITYQLTKLFEWSNQLTITKFKNIKLYLYL